jgi:sugar phosphate isomerase/epimerase
MPDRGKKGYGMPARLLFSTGSLYLLDTAQCFALAAEAGCDGIEVMCDDRWTTRDPHYLRSLSERYQIPVLVLHTPFSQRIPGWREPQRELARIEQTLALAEQLHVETIVVHLPARMGWARINLPPWSLRLPWFSQDAQVVRWMQHDLSTMQQQTPIKIAIENMPGLRVANRTLNRHWWNTIVAWRSVHTWLTLDTTHWATFGLDPLAAYHAAGTRLAHIHLSNFDRREHRLPQCGQLDLRVFLRQLAMDNFGGTISLELHPDALAFQDAEACSRLLKESVEFCRTHLGST